MIVRSLRDDLTAFVVDDDGKLASVQVSPDGRLYCVSCTELIRIGLAVSCRHVKEVKKMVENIRIV